MKPTRWMVRVTFCAVAAAMSLACVQADDAARVHELWAQAKRHSDEGKKDEAVAILKQAIDLSVKTHGESHLDSAGSKFLLAEHYLALGRYREAEPLYRSALVVTEVLKGPNELGTALILHNLGYTCRRLALFADAESYLLRAVKIREAKQGINHWHTAVSLSILGDIYASTSRYHEAENVYVRALAIKETQFGKDHPNTAMNLYSLGNIYRVTARYKEAETLLLRALVIQEAALGKDHDKTGRICGILGSVYTSTGRYEEAERYILRTLAIQEVKLGKDHPFIALTLVMLAHLYEDKKQFDKVEPLYFRALAIQEATNGKDHPSIALVLDKLGSFYRNSYDRGSEGFRRAEAFYLRALAIKEAKLGPNDFETSRTLHNLALYYSLTGEWEKAAAYRDRDRRAAHVHVTNTLPALFDREQDTFLDRMDRYAYEAALSHGLARSEHSRDRELSAAWLLNRKAIAGQVRAESVLLARESRDAEAGPLSRELAETRRLQAALGQQQGITDAERSRQAAELAAKELNLSRRLSQITGRSTNRKWIELADVRQALPRDGVLIEIARFERDNLARKPGEPRTRGDGYAAWIIAPTGDTLLIDLGDAGPIDAAVKAARRELDAADRTIKDRGEPAAEEQLRRPLEELSKLVLRPLLPHIQTTRTWIISPDGPLWLVPWSALPISAREYVAEQHTLRYVVCGRDLLTAKNPRVVPSAPLVMADPDFDDVANQGRPSESADSQRGLARDFKLGRVRRLPGTALEAEAIAPRLTQYVGQPARLYTEKAASVRNFKAVHSPRVLVLSTHGFFLEDGSDAGKEGTPIRENPLLRCGLLMAGCNNAAKAPPGGDTGVLTGLEIVGTDLRGTELVVLSACETGLGDVRNGEGVAGLRQAFQLAGAESMVATLWQVPDRDSALLMSSFFDKLAAKQARDVALAEAQREMIKNRRDRFGAAHPYFWAAYTLTGQAK